MERFVTAVLVGDVRAVAEVLHPEVRVIGDAGGKARTAVRVVTGVDKVTRFFAGLLRTYRPGAFETARPVLVNGDLGMHMPAEPGGGRHRDLDEHVLTVAMRDGRIVTVYDMANPDKLAHLHR